MSRAGGAAAADGERWRALRTAATALPSPPMPQLPCLRRPPRPAPPHPACSQPAPSQHPAPPPATRCHGPGPGFSQLSGSARGFSAAELPRIPSSRRTRRPANHDGPGSRYAHSSLAPFSDSPKPPSCLRRIASSSPRLMLPFTLTPITFLSQANMLLFHPPHRCPGDAATPILACLSSTTVCSPCSHRTYAHADTSCCSPSPPPRLLLTHAGPDGCPYSTRSTRSLATRADLN
jgi:hypothetical protein